jgi:hypothetical protein
MKVVLVLIVGMFGIVLTFYCAWRLKNYSSYSLKYEQQVRQTVMEMVKEECLIKESK